MRRQTWILAMVLGLALVAAAVVPRLLDRERRIVVDSSAAARQAREQALPPARSLGKPASVKPAKIERRTVPLAEAPEDLPGRNDGLVTTLTITTEPFEITRQYRSMEGPYAEMPIVLGDSAGGMRELMWWKGARIEVLDEDERPIGQEFMCHLNLDVSPPFRSSVIGQAAPSTRLLTLTQGELSFALPKGRAVPPPRTNNGPSCSKC